MNEQGPKMSRIANSSDYFVGQVVPRDPVRGIVHGPDTPPVWHALIVPAQREVAAREFLRAHGIYAFFPSESRYRTIAGKRIEREAAIVSRVVYAKFHQAPQWDVMRRYHRMVQGVFSRFDPVRGILRPVQIPPEIIKALHGVTVEAERIKQAQIEMRRARAMAMQVRPGDRAEIVDGPLAGFLVDVAEVRDGAAWFEFLTGGKGRATVESLAPIRGLAQDPDAL